MSKKKNTDPKGEMERLLNKAVQLAGEPFNGDRDPSLPSLRSIAKELETTRLLQDILKDGAVPVSEINQIMAKKGIGSKTAQRAKVRIGAEQTYENGIPVWRKQ